MNWDFFKVRCSAIGKVMAQSQSSPQITEKQSLRICELNDKLQKNGMLPPGQVSELSELEVKKANSSVVTLSDTCLDYLMEEFAWRTARKKRVDKDFSIVFIQKGRLVEPESIELISFLDDVAYEKNTERISNDFLSGEPDVFVGDSIYSAAIVRDVKSIWDYPTFLCKLNKKPDNGYTWQLKGYGDITSAKELSIDNCLVNIPEIIRNDYLRKLSFKMQVATDEDPEYKIAAAEMVQSMIFDDISPYSRLHRHNVEPFTDFERQSVYDKVKVCREFLFEFNEKQSQLIPLASK